MNPGQSGHPTSVSPIQLSSDKFNKICSTCNQGRLVVLPQTKVVSRILYYIHTYSPSVVITIVRYASICCTPYNGNCYDDSKVTAKAKLLEAWFCSTGTVIMIVNYDRNTFIVQTTGGSSLFMCKLKITKLYIFIWFLGFCNLSC